MSIALTILTKHAGKYMNKQDYIQSALEYSLIIVGFVAGYFLIGPLV